MAVNWCIAFPYAPNEPFRAEAFDIVQGFYSKHFPTIPQLVHSATPVGEPFLRAKTRNQLVTMAEKQGYDIVCLIDADTLIHPDGINRMIEKTAAGDMFLGKPFFKGLNLPLVRFKSLASSDLGRIWPPKRFDDPGAAWIIRPSSWWAAGGMDENFRSWGGEDTSFSYLFAAVGGTTEYDRLPAVKAEHRTTKRWAADPDWPVTRTREAVCYHIWQNPSLAEEWISVRDQPGAADEWLNRFEKQPMNRRAWRPSQPAPQPQG